MYNYTISVGWLVALVITPFILGLLAGLAAMKRAITIKLLETLTIDEFKELTGLKTR